MRLMLPPGRCSRYYMSINARLMRPCGNSGSVADYHQCLAGLPANDLPARADAAMLARPKKRPSCPLQRSLTPQAASIFLVSHLAGHRAAATAPPAIL